MLINAGSDIGKVRKTNEDSYLCAPPHLFMVADGMGGHLAGEVASQLGTATVAESMSQQQTAPSSNPAIDIQLRQAIEAANAVIFAKARENPEYAGMGTTLTAVYIQDETVYWGHLGDSRLYLFREQRLTQITDDHSLVGELMRSGALSQEEAQTHPRRNILTRAAGVGEHADVDCGRLEWRAGDQLLLCTDGLTGLLSDPEIADILGSNADDGARAVNALLAGANQAGGPDNVTAVLLAYTP